MTRILPSIVVVIPCGERMRDAYGLAVGSLVGNRFEVHAELARGGMGTLYRAEDVRERREVALKVLRPELVDDPVMSARFLREAAVIASLDSPHIVCIYDSGIDAAGVPYIAMEYLRGADLRDYVSRWGPPTRAQSENILMQVAAALTTAHRAGIVHRDLKPENVFWVDANPSARVALKLLDFGVVKVLDPEQTSGLGTAAIGSPLWMAPEQTTAGGRIAPATDVWSYALLAFQLFTGHHYWKSARKQAGLGELIRELHLDPIIPASERAAELGWTEKLPGGFDGWFLRAMERDATRRFRDAEAAWSALSMVLSLPEDPVIPETRGVDVRALRAQAQSSAASGVQPGAQKEALPHPSRWASRASGVAPTVSLAEARPDPADVAALAVTVPSYEHAADFTHSARPEPSPLAHGISPAPPPGERARPANSWGPPTASPIARAPAANSWGPPAGSPAARAPVPITRPATGRTTPVGLYILAVLAVGLVMAVLSALIVWTLLDTHAHPPEGEVMMRSALRLSPYEAMRA